MPFDDRDDELDYSLTFKRKRARISEPSMPTFELSKSHTEEKEESDNESSSKTKKLPHLSESDVASRCFSRDNHIYFFSGVSKDSVYRLQEQLIKLNTQHASMVNKHPELKIVPKPIYLHINSFGGGVFAAFAAIDFIKQSKIPVHTIIEGASASAATIMSVVGKKRYIRPHASMLIHQLSSWFGGKLTEIEDDYKNVQQMHDSIKDIYKAHTRLRESELDDMLKHDLWWKADKCLEVGLVDAIWDGNDDK